MRAEKLIEVPMTRESGMGGRAVDRSDPARLAMEIHASEAAEKAATRAKDMGALEQAVLTKLEAQRDFAAVYKGHCQPGLRTDLEPNASTGAKWCAAYGFAHRTVQRWCEKLLDEASFNVEKHKRLLKAWEILEMQQAANFSSESAEWYTPEKYIKAVRELLGGIDLDPASSEAANETVGAAEIFTKDDNSLSRPWHGRIFLNPPYGVDGGESVAGLFCKKAILEHEAGRVKAGVILVNSLHSQQWQRPVYDYPICFVDHRIKFVSGDGQENKNPTFQNIFIYLGNELERFAELFGGFGYVMVKA